MSLFDQVDPSKEAEPTFRKRKFAEEEQKQTSFDDRSILDQQDSNYNESFLDDKSMLFNNHEGQQTAP